MKNSPDLLAKVRLFRTEEGGRKGPTPTDQLHCMMLVSGLTLDVRLYLHDTGSLHPGDEAIIPIWFLYPDLAKPHVAVNQTFKLRELRVIGEGIVQKTYW